MSQGRSLASPAFPDDDGSIAPDLAAAFAEFDQSGDPTAILAALCGVRVFVPVIALLGDAPAEGDKDADMAAIFMTGADGRKALLAFSSVDAMSAWDPQARPVPIHVHDAALAAIDEEASAMLLDLGGPHFAVVETEDLKHLAARHQLVQSPAGAAWITT